MYVGGISEASLAGVNMSVLEGSDGEHFGNRGVT